jgi:hypothetical protein
VVGETEIAAVREGSDGARFDFSQRNKGVTEWMKSAARGEGSHHVRSISASFLLSQRLISPRLRFLSLDEQKK